MSVVDKLLIKGIRSFSPENTHVITFYRPLTLIVGPNGAGKTTIIECLKHACTGEMPPNSRSGHSFIHDPKVAGETETKGQIKLRFKTAAQKDVVCIRSFQLTQKGAKMEFKAIESVLQTIDSNTGEKVSLSYRCADMDREVPALMGVSKAVLENVIFVHQDDANWPLAEASVLKKKFDDIFSATRYTKALEVIKKLYKEQNQEIKMYKLKLENLQTLKDAAYKLRDSIDQDNQKAAHLRSQINEYEGKIRESQKKREMVESCLDQIRGLQNQIQIKEGKRETLMKLKAQQFKDLEEENEDTDEELATWQAQFQEKVGLLNLKITRLERESTDIDRNIQFIVDNFSKDCQVKGKLQAELEAHQLQKNERDQSIQALFTKHNLGRVGALPLSNEVAVKHLERATNRLDELSRDHEQQKEANTVELGKLWAAVETATMRYSQAEGQINAKRDLKAGKIEEMQRLDTLIKKSALSISKNDLKRLDENEKSTMKEMEKCSLLLSTGDFDARISASKSELATLDEKLKSFQREKDGLASESMDRIYLRSKKEELSNKESSLSQIMSEHQSRFSKVLKGRTPNSKNLKQEIDLVLSSSKAVVADLNRNSMEAGRELVKVTSMLQEAVNNLSKLQRDRDGKKRMMVSRLASILQQDADVDAFPVQLEDAKKSKDTKKSHHDLADGMRRMFEPFENVARSNHCCPCCERPFSPAEEDDFVKKQRAKSSSTSDRIRELQSQVTVAETKYSQLDKLRGYYDEYQKLVRDVIPQAERTVEELTEEKERVTDPHDDLLGLLAQANSELEAVECLRETVDTVDRLHSEITDLRQLVRVEEDKLDARAHALRTIDDVNKDLQKLEEKRDETNKILDRLREEQSRAKDEYQRWNLRYHNAREEKLKAVHNVETLNKLKDDRRKMDEQLENIEMDIEMLQDTLAPLSKEKDRLAQEHEAFKKKVDTEDTERSWELRKFKQEVNNLQSVSSQILAFLASGKEAKFKEVNERLGSSKSQQEKEEKKKAEVLEELKRNKEYMADHGSVMRNIDDNLKYRKTAKEVQELQQEIEGLEEQIVAIGEASAMETELRKTAGVIQSLLSQQSRSQGTVSAYESNVSKNKADLKQVQYKDIDKRYCAQLVQLKTTEMANKDLDKYYKAVDTAVMRFHSLKMEEINKIIKELWQQTYRGQDIDYIEIRSDSEGAGTRSYSYRVVMRTGDAELEMRGRCSAGQKVLASLIIRLALSETFCLNCGVLALDEPTTNLDGPNAESLASALVRIMEDRRGQENFQLIVITHDERFAQLIGQRQHAERYYRISKDDHQHSIIEAQMIFD
ncbi:DNA repair protein RAD50 [Marchantia polymorpha subsp. ruderalis]|uniref:DNA repair protein RAD50 n=2 Tax=Marchantia polymorpha TaxID=3197 RepID=A0AAF6BEV8_MARPO|nr:hypothetical protein MARPO_0027s0186 [Marchantia polymorpha]BBN10542.1 hypothetical protein Mp_5g04390 [Marchantia polymorpha subsp. ruderalis]|eukprot:PTQ43092.1 hypothetical protein MARPO_0027s0186 [Marchantia polymorpha]